MAVNGIFGSQGGAWDWLNRAQSNSGVPGGSRGFNGNNGVNNSGVNNVGVNNSGSVFGSSDGQNGNSAYGIFGQEEQDGYLAPDEVQKKLTGRKSTPEECETCKNRKYQDGSDEMVSFKAAGHIAPEAAAAVVMGHEQEHVSNAYQKAKNGNGEVVRASVQLKTAICPECGRTYIAGGETNTQIRYYNEDNPYQKDMKESDADNKYRGANVDISA